jgi:sugar O-acyltransferase (sialic acid O-acetyltransferase NeuD family)
MAERKIWIIGASGFAFDIACKFARVPGNGNVLMGFIDSREEERKKTKLQCEQIGLPAMFEDPNQFDFTDPKNRFMFGVGDAQYKKQFARKYSIVPDQFHRFEQDPNINEYAIIGAGIYWGCRLASNVSVGNAVFIDANSVIGHGVSVGDFCHIAVGVIIGGNAQIGEATYIHSGAIIGNEVTIGENCVVGVGAVVVRDLPAGSKVISPKSPTI